MQNKRLPRVRRLVFVATTIAVGFYQIAFAEGPPPESSSTFRGAPAVCFAPGTSPEVVERVARTTLRRHEASSLSSESAQKFQGAYRWTSTATNNGGLSQGDPMTLTWSVVPDGTLIPGGEVAGEATNDPSNLRAFLTGIYGSEAAWLSVMQQVFDRWSSLTGITYVYEPNDDGGLLTGYSGQLGVRGDIRISGHRIDGTYNVLAYNYYPNSGDMVIDTNDTFYSSTYSNSLGLRNVLAHEHGHGLGFSHVCPINETKLMEPFVTFDFDGPQHDDILLANRFYGDRFEHNETSGAAEALGSFGSLTASNLSVDSNSDVDYFSVTVDPGSELDLAVTPTGLTYLSGPQVGACDSGASYNSLIIQDLAIRVLASNGSSELASADSNGVGASESLTAVSLAAGGTYYVEVTGDASDAAQLYQLSLTVSPSDEVFTDGFESSTTTEWTSTVQ